VQERGKAVKQKKKAFPKFVEVFFVTWYGPLSSLLYLSSHLELVLTKIKSNKYGSTSYSYACSPIWNSLPFSVRFATTLAQFCSSLKTHLCLVALEN
jgi:hypothetical protein